MTESATLQTPTSASARPPSPLFWLAISGPLAAVLWAYWPNFLEMHGTWATNPQYSHGYLVPLFAVFLLWVRRDRLRLEEASPIWWGVLLLLGAAGLRFFGAYRYYLWFDAISLLPCLFGLTLLIGGWMAFRWAWPAIAFLFFMIKMPFTVDTALSGPLQAFATLCSTFLLQTLGLPAVAEGNIIRLNDHQIGIVEACSGLRMLIVFFALSTGMVLLIKAPLPDKLLLVSSSVPIALLSNILRITVTGFLHETVNSKWAEVFYHDVAGWLMMPLALGFLWLELKLLNKLFIEVQVPAARGTMRGRQQRSRPVAAPRPRPARPRTAAQTASASPTPPDISEPAALTTPPEQLAPHGVPA